MRNFSSNNNLQARKTRAEEITGEKRTWESSGAKNFEAETLRNIKCRQKKVGVALEKANALLYSHSCKKEECHTSVGH